MFDMVSPRFLYRERGYKRVFASLTSAVKALPEILTSPTLYVLRPLSSKTHIREASHRSPIEANLSEAPLAKITRSNPGTRSPLGEYSSISPTPSETIEVAPLAVPMFNFIG
jgi:hypothetical protein